MVMKNILLLLTLLLIYTTGGLAQQPSNVKNTRYANIDRHATYETDSVWVVSDIDFRRKDTNRWLLGDHYRREWITPVKVPVVRLDTLFGGVTAEKEGGGMQTRSLQLEVDGTNKEYVIRSIEKYPERALPPEFAGTLAADFLKDQISSAHPFAPPVVAALAEAAGIYHTNPRMVFIPRSERLKEYDNLYGNQLYMLEERARGNWQEAASFGYSTNIISTEKFLEQLMKSPAPRVDEAAFLRARLLDLLAGDWDRHEDQWNWAEVRGDTAPLFRPIPKDRDQAFANLDGVLPWIGRRKWALRKAQHFDHDIPDIKGLMWQGRNLDRLLLTSLEWADWEREVRDLQSRWTDAVLEDAVRKLPPELYPISGPIMREKMISRRNDLLRHARDYYEALAKEVEWHGTEGPDRFVVSSDDTAFRVVQYSQQNGSWTPVKERTFEPAHTREVRLFGLGGGDEFVAEGTPAARVRWIGGEGQDQYRNNQEGGKGKAIHVYDTSPGASEGELRLHRRYDSLTHQYQYGRFDYHLLRPVLLPGYNPDDGVYIGGGIEFRKHEWGHDRFAQQHFIGANYAFRTGAYNFWYDAVFNKAIGAWDVLLQGRLNQPNYVLNFYGLGNNTELVSKSRTFNRVRISQGIVRTGLQRTLNTKHTFSLLGELESNRVENFDKRFVSPTNPALDSSQFERHHWLGGTAAYTFSSVNRPLFPTKGVIWNNTSRYGYTARQSKDFFNQEASFAFFLPLGETVFASRLGGATLWGEPQFFQYNQLSGLENLRGYRRGRFTGKTMVYNNNELRIPLTNFRSYLVAGKLGLSLFVDNGRVWMPDEDSNRWHWGYGGGVWFLPFGRVAFSAHYGISSEDKVLTVRSGFLF